MLFIVCAITLIFKMGYYINTPERLGKTVEGEKGRQSDTFSMTKIIEFGLVQFLI